jgi:TRAP-type C4-dicarboxylate transport system permease small subunit
MKKLYDSITKTLSWISFYIMIAFTLLVAIQVISRYVFNSPTTWTELVARYLFVWSVMLYMPVVYRQNANPAFDLLHNMFAPNIRKWVDLIIHIAVLFCALFLIRWGSQFCIMMKNKMVVGLGHGVKLPMNIAYAAIPTGAVLLAIMCFEKLIELSTNFRKAGTK